MVVATTAAERQAESDAARQLPEAPRRDLWTTINGVPLERRLQTGAVAAFVGALPLTALCFGSTAYMLLKRPWTPYIALYLMYIALFDKSQTNGRKKSFWFRNLNWWRKFRDFFPISVHRTGELDPDRKYVFGYHPHGIIGFGAISCFATEAHDLARLFPGLDVYLVTLPINFRIPFLREVYLMLGLLDASKETFKNILSGGSGRAIAVVVGGAAESLKSEPGKMDLVIKSRKGFVRQALLYEADLVPVLGFGETDVFGTVRSARLIKLQTLLQKKLGFAMPLFHGRGVFQYHFGIIPHRRPIKVVFGRAIPVPRESEGGRKIADLGETWLVASEEGRALVASTHALYMAELERIHNDHHRSFGDPVPLQLN